MPTTEHPREERWNLLDLFPSEAEFECRRRELEEQLLPPLDAFCGRVTASAVTLHDALEAWCAAQRRLQALHAYASLKADEDMRAASYQALRQEIHLLWTELGRRTASLRPEILAEERARIERFLAEEPRLRTHAFFLRELLRQRAHVLSPGEERILAETGLLRGQAGALHSLFENAEMPRPEVTLSSGETIRATPVQFHRHRATPLREDRARLFPAYFGAYADFRHTLGLNLQTTLKEHLFTARSRGYASCLEAALDSDNVPPAVYRNLIAEVRAALPLLHRYFGLRRRFLGLERLEYVDLHCPLGGRPATRYTTTEARELVRASLAPLGDTYRRALERAFAERWIDWHPAPGKRSGAYANGAAYDAHPYVLLNFNGDYESVSTLTHELGHALHSHFSNEAQPFPTADYSIFVAEVASIFNEFLLVRHVMRTAVSPEARLFVLGSHLDAIRGTLFRQTLFAEFELAIHAATEEQQALTGESLSEMYLGLLRHYHGHDAGVLEIDARYAIEWAAVPHFHYNYYVYQYATGLVAAGALAEAVLEGGQPAAERYLAFLRAGGSDHPLELLRRAGVDLERPEPYRATWALLARHLDQLEELQLKHTAAGAR